jgi:DNA transformation protein and related proteins
MSRRNDPFVDDCVDLLSVAGPLRTRPIFGGVGFFRGQTMFAFAAGRRLYLKTDGKNRARFEEAGSGAYAPPGGQAGSHGWRSNLSYHELPPAGWESPEETRRWVESAIAAARRDRDPRPG